MTDSVPDLQQQIAALQEQLRESEKAHDIGRQNTGLKQDDRQIDEFLAMLAHELRNPLAPIASAIAMLNISNTSDNPVVSRACDIVERQTRQLTRIVDDLLDVSRVTRGKVVLQKQPLSIAAMVADAIEISNPLITALNHRMDISLPPNDLFVDGDAARLSQVLANVLNNAARYTEDGGDIWLSVSQTGAEVLISVRDTGIGMPSELLTEIFNIFTQSERSIDRSQGGLGIGLTIARSIIVLHGGRIEARSQGPGHGSEFVIHLPLLEQQPSANAQQEISFTTEKTIRRILVVDDNRDAADGMAMLLDISGHITKTAYDGLEAIAAAESFKPELVLLDIGLPHMDGYAVAKHLRQQASSRDIVLAALTGYGDDDDRRRSREAGFNYHFVKPMEFAILNELLEQMDTR